MFLKKKRKRQRFWVQPVVTSSEQQGEFPGLIQELKLYHESFHTYFRMSVRQFKFLLAELGPAEK